MQVDVPRGLNPALYRVPGLKPALHRAGPRVAVLAVGLTAMMATGCTSPRPEPPHTPAAPISVSTAQVASVDLPSWIEAGGLVQAGSTAHVTSRVMALIQDVHVRAGDRVIRGQRLVTLDARELTANTARGSAAMAAATESARAAESRTAAAEAALRLATATHARISGLAEKRSATPQELDQAVAALRAAEAQVQTARSESAAATAAREAARAAAEASTVASSYAVLTAPFDGIVADRLADPGSLATPGSPIVVVEESGPVRFEVRLDQSRAAGLVAGQEAQVRIDGDATWLAAKVIEVGRTDVASHSFLVTLELPSNTQARTGSFGLARFAGAPRRTLVVPSSGLVRRAGLVFLFAIDADKRARLRPVVVGTVDGARAEILAGIADGDTIVVSPPATITDGSLVEAAGVGAAGGRP